MSEKVYVVCCHVVDEDIPLKAFHDIKKAEGYMEECAAEEEYKRKISEMCRNCDKADPNCMQYKRPDFWDTDCDTRDEYEWRENESFWINEIPLEE
jgi:hypothetical protein